MLKVHVLYEYSGDLVPHGASTVRLLLPLSHPKLAGSIQMTSGISYEGFDVDIIILDRLWKPGININDVEKLFEYAHKNKITLIYSIDDNLLDLKLIEPGNIHPSVQQRNIIRYLIRESDGVLVSTYPLRERIRNLNEQTIVIENTLDERLFDEKTRTNLIDVNKNKDQLVIGYMGTFTHDRDFMIILPALKKILHKYHDSIRLEILGALSDKRLLTFLPNTTEVDTNGNSEYTKFMKWMNENTFWDFAIAPLEINEFTKCKSDIKFLDYSALGIPGIYSKHTPYESTVIHGKTGLLVENDTGSWIVAFEQMINDENLRISLGKNAKEYAFSNRILDKCVLKWEKALITIHDARTNAGFAKMLR